MIISIPLWPSITAKCNGVFPENIIETHVDYLILLLPYVDNHVITDSTNQSMIYKCIQKHFVPRYHIL